MLQKTKMTFLRLFAIIGFVVLFAIASISLASCSSEETKTVTGMSVNSSGELVVTYSDGSTENLGSVSGSTGSQGSQGAQGETGAAGVGIKEVALEDGYLVVYYTDGTSSDPMDISSLVSSSGSSECEHPEYAIWAEATSDGDGIVHHAATCEDENDPNVVLYYCTTCGHIKVEYEVRQHSYTATEKVAPTCTEEGYDYYVCKYCGAEQKDDSGERVVVEGSTVAATGHTLDYTKTYEVTCVTDGHIDYYCKTCGLLYKTEITQECVGYHTHTTESDIILWEDESVGCEYGGVLVYQCTVCYDMITEEIEAGDHTIDMTKTYEVTKNPTTTSTGVLTGTCSVCGLTGVSVELPKLSSTDYTVTEGNWSSAGTTTDTRTNTYKYTYEGETLSFTVVETANHVAGSYSIVASTATSASTVTTASYISGTVTYASLISAETLKLDSNSVASCSTETAYAYTYTCATCNEEHTIYLVTPHTVAYAVALTGGAVVETTTGSGVYTYSSTSTEYAKTSGGLYQEVQYCTVCGKEIATVDISATKTTTGETKTEAGCATQGADYVVVELSTGTKVTLTDTVATDALGHLINGIRIPDGAIIHFDTDLAYYTTGATNASGKTIITIIYGTYTGTEYAVSGESSVTKGSDVVIAVTANSTCATGKYGTATFFCEDCDLTCTYDTKKDHTFSTYTTVITDGTQTIYVNDVAVEASVVLTVTTTSCYEYAVAAECVYSGYYLVQCSVCGEIHYVEVAAEKTSHTWTYALSSDNSKVIATCSVCGDTADVDITSTSTTHTVAANCQSTGVDTITVTYTHNGKTYSDLYYTEETAVTGHFVNGVEIDTDQGIYIGSNSYGFYAYVGTDSFENYIYGISETDAEDTTLLAKATLITTSTANYKYLIISLSETSTATCSKAGVGIFYCSYEMSLGNYVAVECKVYSGHDWSETATTTGEATATTEGYSVYACQSEGCTETNTVYTAPLGFDTANATVTDTTTSSITISVPYNDDSTDALTITITTTGSTLSETISGVSIDAKLVCSYNKAAATCTTPETEVWTYSYLITITGTSGTEYTYGATNATYTVEGDGDPSGHTFYTVDGVAKEYVYLRTSTADGYTHEYTYNYCTSCKQYILVDDGDKTLTVTDTTALSGTIGAETSTTVLEENIVMLTADNGGYYTLTLSGDDADKVYVYGYGTLRGSTVNYVALNYSLYDAGMSSYILDYSSSRIIPYCLDAGDTLILYVRLIDVETESASYKLTLTLDEDFSMAEYMEENYPAIAIEFGVATTLTEDYEYKFTATEDGTYLFTSDDYYGVEIYDEDGYYVNNGNNNAYSGNVVSVALEKGDVVYIYNYKYFSMQTWGYVYTDGNTVTITLKQPYSYNYTEATGTAYNVTDDNAEDPNGWGNYSVAAGDYLVKNVLTVAGTNSVYMETACTDSSSFVIDSSAVVYTGVTLDVAAKIRTACSLTFVLSADTDVTFYYGLYDGTSTTLTLTPSTGSAVTLALTSKDDTGYTVYSKTVAMTAGTYTITTSDCTVYLYSIFAGIESGTTPSTPTVTTVSYSYEFDTIFATTSPTSGSMTGSSDTETTYYFTEDSWTTEAATGTEYVLTYTTAKTNDKIGSSSVYYVNGEWVTSDAESAATESYKYSIQPNGGTTASNLRYFTIDLSDYEGYTVEIEIISTSKTTAYICLTTAGATDTTASSALASTTAETSDYATVNDTTYTGTVVTGGLYYITFGTQSSRVYAINITLTPAE